MNSTTSLLLRRRHARYRRNEVAELVTHLRSAVPAIVPAHVQDDVVGEMSLTMASPRLGKADIERLVGEFVKAYWKTYSKKFDTVSLDAPIYTDGPTLIDTIEGTSGHRRS